MMTDPIADMLTRIRNASLSRMDRAEMPLSKIKYGRDRESAIAGNRRRSRPGRRVYVGYDDIPKVLNGMGVSIVSTSRGLMTDKQARTEKIGGELLCEVW